MYFNLEIATVSKCNMACTYCFEGEELKTKKKQTPENLDDIINKIEEMLYNPDFQKTYPQGICVNFWGGEPTLNFEWNKTLILKLSEKSYYNKISFFMYSNGYNDYKIFQHLDLFNKEELAKGKFRLQISWDGINNGRINHKLEPTNVRVRRHILELAIKYPELNLSTKATIQPQELEQLEIIWKSYFSLFKELKEKVPNSNTQINFSPTLNYVDDFDDTNEIYLENLKREFSKVSKLEEIFYQKYKFHLFGWFSENPQDARSKRLTNCSAGINMLAIDYDGKLTTCHGALYSEKGNEFKEFHNLDIKESKETFFPKFFESKEKLEKHTNYVANNCITCEATVCYKCPIVNIEQIDNHPNKENKDKSFQEQFQIRDTRHCSIYKLFGKFDRIQMSEKILNFKGEENVIN